MNKLEKICVWKGVIERDIVRYGREGRTEETLKCDNCDGYNESCLAYLQKDTHDRRKLNGG